MMSANHRLIAAGILGVSLVMLPGCLVSGSSKETLSGTYIGPSTFEQIEEGKTTQRWVESALGEPTSKATLEDGSSLWKWSYRKQRSSRGSVFLVFGSASSKESAGASYVQIKDGIVVKAWQD